MTVLRHLLLIILAIGLVPVAVAARPAPVTVLAAASLQEGLTDAAAAWVAKGHTRPVISFAGTPALARQIEAGAPADLFISADEEWMDYLAERRLLAPGTRISLLANRLVLIAPKSSRVHLSVAPRFPLGRALGRGRLAMADPAAVPAGKYAKAALARLGVWPSVARRIAPTENVRAALLLVERSEAPLGVVYATDARASSRVRVVATLPAASHPPITYPIARLARSKNPEAEAFRRFLVSRAGKALFRAHGFEPL